MARILRNTPLAVTVMMAFCVLMLGPVLHAVRQEDWLTARTFFYVGVFFLLVGLMLAIALSGQERRHRDVSLLINLLLIYLVLPAILAVPVEHLVPPITYAQAYFEMLSCLTTTGATIFDDPTAISGPLHLWRGLVSWAGGLMILVVAIAILEPMKLGGFEIEAAVRREASSTRRAHGGERAAPDRMLHHLRMVLPPYLVLTLILVVALLLAGDRTLVAVVHAMSVMSTSGISPVRGLPDAASAHVGEALIFVFLFLVISHRPMMALMRGEWRPGRIADPEYRMAFICVALVSTVLFLRHFVGAFEIEEGQNLLAALRALWGGAFTTLSFLSTTGFESTDWDSARNWSGLGTPGIILLGLCVMGGGIATTAGGVKLLRIYALYKHGQRELQRLIHPHSVGGAGITARRIRREGANIAWVFLMLFLLGIAGLMLLFTLTGLRFETAISLAISSLSNTGPAVFFLDRGFTYATLTNWQIAISGGAMVLGRLELLVFVALFNPDYWRQ